jgi:hypothetical protein
VVLVQHLGYRASGQDRQPAVRRPARGEGQKAGPYRKQERTSSPSLHRDSDMHYLFIILKNGESRKIRVRRCRGDHQPS